MAPPTNDTDEHPSNRQLERRLEKIEALLERLVKLEIEHGASKEAIGRAFIEIGELKGRLVTLERDAPVVSLVKGLVLKLVLAILIGALGAMLALIIPNMSGSRQPVAPPQFERGQ